MKNTRLVLAISSVFALSVANATQVEQAQRYSSAIQKVEFTSHTQQMLNSQTDSLQQLTKVSEVKELGGLDIGFLVNAEVKELGGNISSIGNAEVKELGGNISSIGNAEVKELGGNISSIGNAEVKDLGGFDVGLLSQAEIR